LILGSAGALQFMLTEVLMIYRYRTFTDK
jgi:hypothetical protein